MMLSEKGVDVDVDDGIEAIINNVISNNTYCPALQLEWTRARRGSSESLSDFVA